MTFYILTKGYTVPGNQGTHDKLETSIADTEITIHLFVLVRLFGNTRVGSVHVILKQLVLSEGGRTDCTLVRQVGRLQRLVVVLGHVIQQLPLVHLEYVYKVKIFLDIFLLGTSTIYQQL